MSKDFRGAKILAFSTVDAGYCTVSCIMPVKWYTCSISNGNLVEPIPGKTFTQSLLIFLDAIQYLSFIGSRPSDHYFRSVCWF